MLEIIDVKKKFTIINQQRKKQEILANNGISFTAEAGQIVGVLGPNGAGKTTLLRMIAGILEPTSGTIKFDGKSYKSDEIAIKKMIAYLSGNTKIYNSLSCYELLVLTSAFYDVPKDVALKRISEIIESLNLEEFMHKRIKTLSTGQMQKVNLARLMVHDPKYYILDEATNGLDIMASQVILDFIKREKERKKTILYSTHYMEEAENICDYVIMINNGVIIASGTPLSIRKQTKTTNLRDAFFSLIGGSNE